MKAPNWQTYRASVHQLISDSEGAEQELNTPYEQRREAMARLLAAAVMGLVNDAIGEELPGECWQPMLEKADAMLFIVTNGNTPFHTG